MNNVPSQDDTTPTITAKHAQPDNSFRQPNRLAMVLAHTVRYSIEGQARLAADCGVSRSTISRLVRGKGRPSFALVQSVTAALEKELRRPITAREVFSPDGTYPTASGCALCGCKGCMPDAAYDRHGGLRPDYKGLQPGDWSISPKTSATVQRSATLPVNELL